MRANPLASLWLDAGQWATAALASAINDDVGVGQVDAVGEHGARAEQPGVAQHFDRRAAVPRGDLRQLGVRLAGVDVDAGVRLGGQLTDRPQLVLDSRYVLCGHTQRSPAAVLPSSSRAQRIRTSNGRRSAPGNSTNTGPPSRSKPVGAATAEATSGKKYMSRAVVMPGPQALGDRQRGAGGDRLLRQHGAFGGHQPGEEAVEIEVVGEPAEHRHREVGVGVDEARQDEPAGGVDDDARRRRIGVGGPDRRDDVAVDDDVAAWMHGACGVHRHDRRVGDDEIGRHVTSRTSVTGAAGSPAGGGRCAPPRRRRRP